MSRRAVAIGLLLGAAADRALGDPRRWHPVAGFGRTMQAVEARLWRDERWAGVAHAVVGVTVGALPVWIADRRLRHRPLARTVLTATVTWTALGGRSLATAGREIG
ncbi:MAG: cobalamin biosynthesis protein, partial [Patulibacter sp.]